MNMKNFRKLISAVLILCLLVPVLASCKDEAAITALESGEQGTEQVSGEVTEDKSGVLEVPEDVTYDGYEFVFFTGSNVSTCPHIFTADEEDNAIDEAIYRRNLKIEEQYDITIREEYRVKDSSSGAGAAFMEISKAYDANDNLLDAAVASAYDCGTLATRGMLTDLRDYSYLNLEKKWWDQAANDQLTIYDRTYFTAGDISYIDDNFTYAIVFNKEMATSLQLEDMYALVRDGKWTYDKLYEFSKKATVIDNDNVFGENDICGFLGYCDSIWMSFSSIGSTVASIGSDGALGLSLNTEKNFKMITEWTEFGMDASFINWQLEQKKGNDLGANWKNVYANGQALFFGATIDGIYKLRNTDVNYGFLPWPKYDEQQADYNSGMAPNHISLFCIPDIGNDEHVDRTAILVEALAHGSDGVIKGFYEKNLQGKSVRDDESYETLDTIFAKKVFDLGFYYNIGAYRWNMFTRFRDGQTTFASFYAEQEVAAKKTVKEINDLYKGLLD